MHELIYIQKQKLYSYIALFLSFLFLISTIVVQKLESKPVTNDVLNEYFKKQEKVIEDQTKTIQVKIDSLNFKISQNDLKLEKLSKIRTKISYVYETNIKQIDNLNNDSIVKRFTTFFTNTSSK